MPDSDRSLLAKLRFAFTFEDVRDADGVSDLSEFQGLKASLLSFKDQQWYHQLLVFTVGIAIWIGAYAGIMSVMGWVEYAPEDTPKAIEYRRYAATGALVAAYTYYGFLWTQAYGGLMTNLIWFPGLTIAFIPKSVLGLLRGAPEQRYSPGGLLGEPIQWSVDIIGMLIIGIIPCVLFIMFMTSYWNLAGERGRHHRIEWTAQAPDIMLRDGPSEDWESLSPELQQVFLDAGYEPDEDGGSDYHSVDAPDHDR